MHKVLFVTEQSKGLFQGEVDVIVLFYGPGGAGTVAKTGQHNVKATT